MKHEHCHRCAHEITVFFTLSPRDPHEATVLFHLSRRERPSRAARRERVRVPTMVARGRTLSPNPSRGGTGECFRPAHSRPFSAHAVPQLFDTSSDARFPS